MSDAAKTNAWGDIVLTGKGAYAILTINREAKRNAMNREGRRNMMIALEHVKNRYPVVILTGVGSTFCAGVDLKERADDVARGDMSASDEWVNVNIAIREHPSVFIAAVNGIALGGGATLINVCDLAVAADTVEIGMPEMGFSTYPAMAGPSTQLSLSRKRVSWMVLTAQRISAATALDWGLVNCCVPPGELMATAEDIAGKVAKLNPHALAVAKQALDTIPAVITDWRQGFNYGALANARIQQRNAGENPLKDALPTHKKDTGSGKQ
jgi:enoyl-CoA hydratase/carnithine racemase